MSLPGPMRRVPTLFFLSAVVCITLASVLFSQFSTPATSPTGGGRDPSDPNREQGIDLEPTDGPIGLRTTEQRSSTYQRTTPVREQGLATYSAAHIGGTPPPPPPPLREVSSSSFFNLLYLPQSVAAIPASYMEGLRGKLSSLLAKEGHSGPAHGTSSSSSSPALEYPPMRPPWHYTQLQSCGQLAQQDYDEFARVVQRVDLYAYPEYNMPWYFHDPAPICGRYFLRYLENPAPGVSLTFQYGKHGETGITHTPPKGSLEGVFPPSPAAFRQVSLHRVVAGPRATTVTSNNGGAMLAVQVEAGAEVRDVVRIQHCGTGASSDVLITARVIGDDAIVGAVLAPAADGYQDVRFTAPHAPGRYILEVKLVHVNGSSANPSDPKSLGVIGIRANDNGRKSYKYNVLCDAQRHVYGSPVEVTVVRPAAEAARALVPVPPLCTVANHTRGAWVRFTRGSCMTETNPYCKGDAAWLSDACAFNTGLLWAPEGCRYVHHSPPGGPSTSCLRVRTEPRGAALLLVGDSVMREYGKNCGLFNFRGARLVCVFNNIVLEGQHYSKPYAKAVVKNIVDAVERNRAGVFATNLGIHHMIGPCTTEQWTELVDIFVAFWRGRIEAGAYTLLSTAATGGSGDIPAAAAAANATQQAFVVEKAVWISPPTIHYARRGMGSQRAAVWDAIAWERLAPLGFRRLDAMVPTAPRQEGTWDGLHYASERGKVQSPRRDPSAPVRQWNGGVSAMLFTMLLNLICNGP